MVELGTKIGISTFLRQREVIRQALGVKVNVDSKRGVADIATPDYCVFLRRTKNGLSLEARDFRTDAGVVIEDVTGLEGGNNSMRLSGGDMSVEVKRESGISVIIKPGK